MRLLCVANWSEGRELTLLGWMRAALKNHQGDVHFDGADEDHNRIVTAFSGPASDVKRTLLELASIAFGRIDMRSHRGVHPRIGALDVCPFILLEGDLQEALEFTASLASRVAETFELPIFLYEKSETGKHAADLPSLRKGQFEGLLTRPLDPDFGPSLANPRLGATVLGVRDWLIAMNVDFNAVHLAEAKRIAREIRINREAGDPRFVGVRALGLDLPLRQMSQVSMNLTQPDLTGPDSIIEWVGESAEIIETELIGVIRHRDVAKATRLPISEPQVLDA